MPFKYKYRYFSILALIAFLYYYFKDTITYINNSPLFDDFEMKDSLLSKDLKEDDPILISHITQKYMYKPNRFASYNLNDSKKLDYSMGQSKIIHNLIKAANSETDPNYRFFVECGAYDGEARSNTLYFEKLGWSGLLVEADPKNFAQLLTKNRKCYAVNACLCANDPSPRMVAFVPDANLGHILQYAGPQHQSWDMEKMNIPTYYPCFSLYSLMLSMKYLLPSFPLVIDYLSLDVEGAELEVLKTVPFDKIHIKTISVEYAHVLGGKSALIDYLALHNFLAVDTVEHEHNLANDIIFVNRKDFFQ